jgi:TPR repeat protein
MKKGFVAVTIGWVVLAVGAGHSPATAQSADAVLCDRLAADPTDPDKPADVKGTVVIAPSDVPIAIKYCKTASAASRRALFELGRAYAANQQYPQAIAAYRKAVDKGSTAAMVELGALLEAQFQLGVMYAEGTGGPKYDAAARALFEKAAAQGHAEALDWAGNFAENGRGGPKDKDAAKRYYEQAAALGNDDAKAALERLKCPYVVKDKRGKVVSTLCF